MSILLLALANINSWFVLLYLCTEDDDMMEVYKIITHRQLFMLAPPRKDPRRTQYVIDTDRGCILLLRLTQKKDMLNKRCTCFTCTNYL